MCETREICGKLVWRDHGSLFEIVVFVNAISGSILLVGNQISSGRIDNRRLRRLVLRVFRNGRTMARMATTRTLRPALFTTGGTRFSVLHPCGNLIIVSLRGTDAINHGKRALIATLMRRHGEHGSRKYRKYCQQSAGKIERHGEIQQRTTGPVKHDRASPAIAVIDDRNGILGIIRISTLDLHVNGTGIAFDCAPHVGILERDLAFGIIGGALSRGLQRGQGGPVRQSGNARVFGSRNPTSNIAGGTDGDAHVRGFVAGLRRNVDVIVNQLQHIRISDHILRSRNRSGRRDLRRRLPNRRVQDAKYDASNGKQSENRSDNATHDLSVSRRPRLGLRFFLFILQ